MPLRASELAGLPPKKYHDGQGLYFDKKKRGASWIYKYRLNGVDREMGLGKYPERRTRRIGDGARAAQCSSHMDG